VAGFTTDKQGSMGAPFLAANVGGNVWRRFTLTLDYDRQVMTLAPNADFTAPDDYEHAGLFLVDRNGRHVVLDSRPGTPAAEAGVAKGDVIESIDGAPASSLSLQAVRARFLGAAGEKHTLGLLGKDGARRTVVLTLRPFV
jgi:C-terminal processing protease CtpA/Prc